MEPHLLVSPILVHVTMKVEQKENWYYVYSHLLPVSEYLHGNIPMELELKRFVCKYINT